MSSQPVVDAFHPSIRVDPVFDHRNLSRVESLGNGRARLSLNRDALTDRLKTAGMNDTAAAHWISKLVAMLKALFARIFGMAGPVAEAGPIVEAGPGALPPVSATDPASDEVQTAEAQTDGFMEPLVEGTTSEIFTAAKRLHGILHATLPRADLKALTSDGPKDLEGAVARVWIASAAQQVAQVKQALQAAREAARGQLDDLRRREVALEPLSDDELLNVAANPSLRDCMQSADPTFFDLATAYVQACTRHGDALRALALNVSFAQDVRPPLPIETILRSHGLSMDELASATGAVTQEVDPPMALPPGTFTRSQLMVAGGMGVQEDEIRKRHGDHFRIIEDVENVLPFQRPS